MFIENTTVSEEHQIQETLRACTKNVSRFDYFLPNLKKYLGNKINVFKCGCISSKIEEWESIRSDKEILKTVKGLASDFEPESPSQKTKVMSGQASQNGNVEINKLVGKGVIEYIEHKRRV